ncbi:MAG: 30S ribosomal protein S6 [Candidatus Omnitrophica bacterium]|nr:30S ribosomal protein S6 [Candidatus Omnitrophota bacterium]
MINRYEAMFILKVNLGEGKTKELLHYINDVILRNKGEIISSGIWQENKKLAYSIKKEKEGTYYLVNFKVDSSLISAMQQEYKLNENILRFMFIKLV